MDEIYLNWDKMFDEAFEISTHEIKNDNIVFSGIGGSGIVGEIANILGVELSFRRKFTGKETLIAVSYSGTTTETIIDVENAVKAGSEVIIITSGGILEKFAKEKNLKLVKVPSGFQTRYAFPYLFTPLIKMTTKRRGIKINEMELKLGVMEAKEKIKADAIRLAELLINRIPVIYSSKYLAIAKRFKQEINENAKHPAFYGEIPEINHNEIESYVHGPSLVSVIIESSEIDKITEDVLNPIVIKPYFSNDLKNISSLLALAGVTSLEIAKKLNEKPDKLYNIPKARQLTSKLFKMN
ncbi:bifunctional phosphoglucose/phosphomannose isomerase [Sulfolobus sp. E5-1-F]|uniref:bifunctional phosphoglucose/phosphomannose isomerase n=1 Tax=Sulfolobaceae TaxID=118883 RepID=UPI0012957B46|nr:MULTISPECIES: bifunctional phosphoglucose/phosphomannose isomerase [unclassified Sulfolobus]QGA53446.1 bifunctional phosphoglucose/phosphomannose isomerase [Sulfolobus sp. E5-1-F]QGA68877.1 bifunctional phosphoglucose/phosphomannose isomerase [Sulfolobus sp. E11-6]